MTPAMTEEEAEMLWEGAISKACQIANESLDHNERACVCGYHRETYTLEPLPYFMDSVRDLAKAIRQAQKRASQNIEDLREQTMIKSLIAREQAEALELIDHDKRPGIGGSEEEQIERDRETDPEEDTPRYEADYRACGRQDHEAQALAWEQEQRQAYHDGTGSDSEEE
jgi:hypothetical protein